MSALNRGFKHTVPLVTARYSAYRQGYQGFDECISADRALVASIVGVFFRHRFCHHWSAYGHSAPAVYPGCSIWCHILRLVSIIPTLGLCLVYSVGDGVPSGPLSGSVWLCI